MVNLDTDLEINFINSINKSDKERTIYEDRILKKREKIINQEFELTEDVIAKFNQLNNILIEEENRIKPIYKKLKTEWQEMIDTKLIDDIMDEVKIRCFNDDYYHRFVPKLEGNKFYSISEPSMYSFWVESDKITDWNDYGEKFKLDQGHCYSFHTLLFHSELTWFDICKINEVWLEIHANFQFLRKVEGK